MIKIEDLYKLGFVYDDFNGKYFLHLENDDELMVIDMKISINGKYAFTRLMSGATLRFYSVVQLKEFVDIVKRSFNKQ